MNLSPEVVKCPILPFNLKGDRGAAVYENDYDQKASSKTGFATKL
jgi:hypothetical protein